MFYQEQLDKALRFGDIVRGFPTLSSMVDKPPLSPEASSYQLEVDVPRYTVLLTPCCSIRDNVVSVCPLQKVDKNLLRNPYFKEDLTRINRPMPPKKTIPPQHWDKLSEGERQLKESQPPAYTLLSYFVYAPHGLLPEYTCQIGKEDVHMLHYMIDFRDAFKVRFSAIITPEKAPLDVKCLQLSAQVRKELREKIAYYFGREPEEERMQH